MRWLDSIRLACMQLTRRRLRAFLCALSVAVGVASMVLIAALGTSGQREVRERIGSLGLHGLTIYVAENASGQQLTEKCAASLQKSLPEITHAMAIKAQTGSYRTVATNGSAVFLGVTEELGAVMELELIAGNLLSARQVKSGEPVAVIDEELAKTLYGRENIVGKRVRFTVNNVEQYYRVVGVIRQQIGAFGSFVASVAPSIVYLPYGCLAGPMESADQIMVQCVADADPEETGERIVDFLSSHEQIAGKLRVQDMGGMLGQIEGMVGVATALFLSVAAISFLVAMLGVLSGMLSATHEKKAEIGLYMALGARKRDIARLFLIQSILISIAGGGAGMLVCALTLFTAGSAVKIVLTVPPFFAIVVLGLSAVCGALAGLLPAVHAAGLRPVEAMRK